MGLPFRLDEPKALGFEKGGDRRLVGRSQIELAGRNRYFELDPSDVFKAELTAWKSAP